MYLARHELETSSSLLLLLLLLLFYDLRLQPSGVSTAQLSKSIFNFTDTQDVRVLVGCNAVINHRGDIIKVK